MPSASHTDQAQTPSPGGLETTTVATSSLRLYPGNPRRGNLDAIKDSLEANGQYRPLVVNRRNAQVLAGNHTLMAACELGWGEIAVVFVDADDELARRIVLADNRTSDLAEYDVEALLDLIGQDEDLYGTGYDQAAVGDLLDELEPPSLDEDEVPPPPKKPRTRPGQLIALGSHRVACGDARDPDLLKALMRDEAARVLWTDPPYGVDYEGKTQARLKLKGDRAEGLAGLLGDSFASIDSALAPGAALYVAHPAGGQSLEFLEAFRAQAWLHRQTLVWVKPSLVMGRSDYHYRHEPILYGYKPGQGRLGRGGVGWYGGNRQSTVLEVDRPATSREHPTMKPPALVEICLRNSSRRGEIVLDPFAGSGSTLVAAHRLGRRARLIEIDQRYCDVIVERFERLTGVAAEVL